MRNRLSLVTAALLLASASLAAQQQTPAAPPAAPAPLPALGTIDFGYRGFTGDGDYARGERYRDLRDGAASKFVFGKTTDMYLFDARAENVGYRDQRYLATYNSGKAKGSFIWDSIPLNYSYLTSTPWSGTTSGETASFALSPAARTAVQNRVPGVIGIPTTAAQLDTPSIYRGLATPFDLQQRRDIAGFTGAFDVMKNVGVNLSFTTTKKSGAMPWASSFAFNNPNELPLPLDNRTNDVSAGAEWANDKAMVRIGWDHSWFNNDFKELVWDNPLRATDFNNGLVPPNGPYDPNAYINGNGPASGRMALAPNNSMNVISTTGLYRLPRRTTVNGTLSFTSMKQNDELIPWTINPVIANPVVYGAFPELAELPRETAEAEVRGVNALLNFNTRPSRKFALSARYRYNNHDNRTPAFDAVEYVRFDAVPEETGGETEQFDIVRNTFDVNATYNLGMYTALRAGYGYDTYNRSGRSFSDMTDNIFRLSVDTMRSQWIQFRTMYEHTTRKGSGFSESALEDGGAQPGLRFYDEADRDRDRGTVLVIVAPITILDFTFSLAAGRDTYKGEGHEFGLLDNDNTSVNVGMNVTPADVVTFGINFGRDSYSTFQKSRNANPPPDPQWTDPNRDWTLDNDEKVDNLDLYLNLVKAVKNTDINVSYNYSDSNNGFVFGGPRIQSLTAAGQFQALPDVDNKWRRLTLDVRYYFVRNVGVGIGYWYEKFDVTDFAAIDIPGLENTPRIDYLGEISTGYGSRPYKTNTWFLRLLYLF